MSTADGLLGPWRRIGRVAAIAGLLAGFAIASCGTVSPLASGEHCAPIIDRAIAARGGAIHNLRRTVEMQVYFGFPGTWRFDYVFRVPHFYRWTVYTSEQPNHYLWDGKTMRAAVGSVVVGTDPSRNAPLRTHARWHAVTYLDSLCSGQLPVQFQSLPDNRIGEESLLVRLRDDGSEYRLTFDRQARLRRASGPIDIPPFGAARLTQHYYDFRPAGGFWIAHGTRYEIDGTVLSEEQTLAFVANDPAIAADLFRHGQ